MPSPTSTQSQTPTPALGNDPLADHFFISGLDNDQLRLNDDFIASQFSNRLSLHLPSELIHEDEDEDGFIEKLAISNDETDVPSSAHSSGVRNSVVSVSDGSGSQHISNKRLSTVSARHNGNHSGNNSARSSRTIKAVPQDTNGNHTRYDLNNEADFDAALKHFVAERDGFLSHLDTSAGVVTKSKARARPKTLRVQDNKDNTEDSPFGHLKRRLSKRETTTQKRNSVVRHGSVRAAKRVSNYNSVIPVPQPLEPDPNMHPLQRRWEPVLLDRYPPKYMSEELSRRPQFPDYVPMFAFPNDVSIVPSDERPRSTWHNFAMTGSDNAKLYGVCVIIWLPLAEDLAGQLEKRCDDWRKRNMSDEERELASSLGERLANERAKLSRLLARLPTMSSESEEREELEEEISAVEEKIGMMADLLRPVRHGAASKIDGLTDGDTGLWIPRAYGVLGRNKALTSFWKEWLRAVLVPMTNGGILRVPPSSPRVGMWQPLEAYVVNLCAEALSPISSKTQVEVAIRDLRLFAREEALNELPGSRNTDLYALFKALSIPNVLVLFEFLLSESRIILLSSHTALLGLVSKAMVELLYPFEWAGIFIPVLPARLKDALEAPCPYIVGIERRYEDVELPSDDFVLVDLDNNTIESTSPPIPLPKQQRRKLASILQTAALHHNRFGVQHGPVEYAMETFPRDAFATENPQHYSSTAAPSTLAKYAGLNSASFGDQSSGFAAKAPLLNVFTRQQAKATAERPMTSRTLQDSPPATPSSSSTFMIPGLSRQESSTALQASLREKRSGHFDSFSRRSSSFTRDRAPTLTRPTLGFGRNGSVDSYSSHNSRPSISGISGKLSDRKSVYAPSVFAPSVYAQSSMAASTILPMALHQPVKEDANVICCEGHCLHRQVSSVSAVCTVCDDRISDDVIFQCNGCSLTAHARCVHQIPIVCPGAFKPDQIRAAFVRCFASLLYTYRKHFSGASTQDKKAGLLYKFNESAFLRDQPRENAAYMAMLKETQAFNEFIHEREKKPQTDPSIMLFDQIILAKRNRGKSSFFGKSQIAFLADTSDHIWRTATANPASAKFNGEYSSVISRIPTRLDPAMLREPRVVAGIPRAGNTKARRRPVPSMLMLDNPPEGEMI